MPLEGTSVGSIYGQLKLNWSSFQASMAQVNTQLGALGDAFKKAGQQWTTAGRTLMTSFTIPIALLGAAAGKTFTDFELSMSRIEGLVGLSKDAVDDLAESVKQLSPQVGKAPKELAEALYYITSAGIPASQAMGVLEVSAKAAAAGLGTTQVVADAVTSAMNAYASTGMTAAKATDIMTAAVKYGKLEADALAPVLGQVISVASSLGISFDQVAGSMAAMSRTGVDASQSATALTAIMSMLLKPTKQGTDLLVAHGLSLKGLRDMAAQPGGLIEVLRTLDTTFEGDDEAMAALVPNIRALRGVLNLLTQNASTVDEVLQGVTNSTGALDLAFQAYADTAKSKLDTAISTLKVTLVDVGEAVMPMVTAAATAVTEALKTFTHWWTELDKGQQKFIITAALVVAAIGPLIYGFGTVLTSIGAISTALSLMTTPVGIAIAALAGIAAVVGLVIASFKDLDVVMNKPVSMDNLAYYRRALEAYDAETARMSGTYAGQEEQRAAGRLAIEKKIQEQIDGVRGQALDKQAKGQIEAALRIATAEQAVRDAKTTEEKAAATASLAAAKAAADALVEVNKAVADKLYKITHTTVENQIYDLKAEAAAFLAAGGKKVEIDTWYAAASKIVYADAAAAKVKAEEDAAKKATAAWEEANNQQVQDIKDTYDEYIDALRSYANIQQDVHDTLTRAIIDDYGQQEDAAIRALEAGRDSVATEFDAKIDALQANRTAQQRKETLAGLREAVTNAKTGEERTRAQAALDRELKERVYQETLDDLRSQRQVAIDAANKQIDDAKVYYADKKLLRNAEAEAEKLLASTTQTDIIAMLRSRLSEWEGLGSAIGDSLFSGLQAAIGSLSSLITATAPTAPGATGGGSTGMQLHASGGYFTTPHIAAIAEAEPEWVVPQSRAAEFAGKMGGGSDRLLRDILFKLEELNVSTRGVASGVGAALNGVGRV
jgi:TP901 family phage tail tape measure protein